MMATTARPTPALIAETPEEQGYLEELKASRRALQEALLNRQQLFDPTLLAMAQGFLAPTKTGSFGESLANVAAQVGPVQQKERERELQMFQIRAELAAQQVAEAQALQERRMLQNMPSLFGAPAARGEPPAAAPGATPGASTATTGAAPAGAPGAPREINATNTDDVLAYLERVNKYGTPALREAAKTTLELMKFRREGIEIRDGIVINKNQLDASGQPTILADLRQKQEPTEIVYQGRARTIPMTGLEIQQFKTAREQGPEAEKKYFETYLAGRRSGPEAMPYGGKLEPFRIAVPDPMKGNQYVNLTGEATPRDIAMLNELATRAREETGDFAPVMRLYNALVGTGVYQGPKQAAATPAPVSAAAPAQAPTRPAASQQAAPQQPAPNLSIYQQELDKAVQQLGQAMQSNDPTATNRAQADVNSLRREIARVQNQPVGIQIDEELAKLPVAEQNKIIADRIVKSEKEAQDQISLIRKTGAPALVIPSNQRLKEIRDIARDHPDVVGLLSKEQGFVPALLTAANSGFKVGDKQVSFPVTEFVEKLSLTPKQQTIARRMAMLLDQEFFFRAEGMKSVLGPSISNADVLIQKSTLAKPEDSARLIAYWATHGMLTNKQLAELYDAANRLPAGANPKPFITSDVRRVMDSYTPQFERIARDFRVVGR